MKIVHKYYLFSRSKIKLLDYKDGSREVFAVLVRYRHH